MISLTHCKLPTNDEMLGIIDGIVIILIILIALIENIAIIYILLRTRSLQTPTNILIGCLSSADIFITLLPLPFTFAVHVCSWQQNDTMSSMYLVVNAISCMTSVTSLTVLACDRYFIIVHPYVYERHITINSAFLVTSFVWIYGIGTGMLALAISQNPYTLLTIIMTYFLPSVIMFFCNIRVAMVAKQHAKNILKTQVRQPTKTLAGTFSILRKMSRVKFEPQRQQNGSIRSTATIDSEFEFDLSTDAGGIAGFNISTLPSWNYPHTIVEFHQANNIQTNISITHEHTDNNTHKKNNNRTIRLSVSMDECHCSFKNDTNKQNCTVCSRKERTSSKDSSERCTEDIKCMKKTRFLDQNNQDTSNVIALKKPPAAIKRNFRKFVQSNIKASRKKKVLRNETLKIVNQLRRLRQELKAAFLLSIVMGIFLCLWTPLISLNIMDFMGILDLHNRTHIMLIKYFNILYYSNAAINPACYVFMNSKLRRSCKILLLSIKKTFGVKAINNRVLPLT